MLTVLIRTAIFYFLTMLAMRFMGKRQIGELEPAELVVTIIISELATIPIQDPASPLINSVIAIFALASMEILISAISMKSNFFRTVMSGKYSVIIENGRINQTNMRRSHLTLDELFEEIRQHGATELEQVRLCVIETSGKMSVFLKNQTEKGTLPLILIVDGKAVKENILKAGLTENTVEKMAKTRGFNGVKDVFCLEYHDGKMSWTGKEN